MPLWEGIGIAAAFLTMFGFFPQAFKIMKERSVKDISLVTVIQFGCGSLLWILYGLHLRNTIIIIANVVTFTSLVLIGLLYVRYRRQ